ncbi:hypothetical protein pdam_00014671, partial [Pocillopora damicornis]
MKVLKETDSRETGEDCERDGLGVLVTAIKRYLPEKGSKRSIFRGKRKLEGNPYGQTPITLAPTQRQAAEP